MIEYIKGVATELTPTYAVIEAGQIGYLMNISLPTFEEIQRTSGELKMLVHEVIREDAHRQQSQKVLKRIFDADPAIKVETAIKKALSMM